MWIVDSVASWEAKLWCRSALEEPTWSIDPQCSPSVMRLKALSIDLRFEDVRSLAKPVGVDGYVISLYGCLLFAKLKA